MFESNFITPACGHSLLGESARKMISRRNFLAGSLAAASSFSLPRDSSGAFFQGEADRPLAGERPFQHESVRVINPQGRVPVSFIIDDSTTLVNLAHFCIPQFAEVFPARYKQDWRSLPREIPDSFVREFGQWCRDHGVKGKYSVVPNPALVGWVDRDLPGWSRKQLQESLQLVRDFMSVDWDIHPEMITHTWVINTKTGRPYEERSERYMENWGWSVGRSTDELADYLAYALRILKNAGLICEGVTTPGGFGSRSLRALSEATLQACRDVYATEVPHYFRHLYTDDNSVAPRVEFSSGLKSADPRCAVSVIGCTGDWFGGWDGLTLGSVDRFITADLQGGRMPEVIDRGEPAIMVCHWPGIYYNGEKRGFHIFQEVVRRLHERYDNLLWMKLSEIARYWAAKELTEIRREAQTLQLNAPFASPRFTLTVDGLKDADPTVVHGDQRATLQRVSTAADLVTGKYHRADGKTTMCFDLTKGQTDIH